LDSQQAAAKLGPGSVFERARPSVAEGAAEKPASALDFGWRSAFSTAKNGRFPTGFSRRGELISKLLKRMEPTSGLEPLTCRLRIIDRSRRWSS
jgi:hypothetical protein